MKTSFLSTFLSEFLSSEFTKELSKKLCLLHWCVCVCLCIPRSSKGFSKNQYKAANINFGSVHQWFYLFIWFCSLCAILRVHSYENVAQQSNYNNIIWQALLANDIGGYFRSKVFLAEKQFKKQQMYFMKD